MRHRDVVLQHRNIDDAAGLRRSARQQRETSLVNVEIVILVGQVHDLPHLRRRSAFDAGGRKTDLRIRGIELVRCSELRIAELTIVEVARR